MKKRNVLALVLIAIMMLEVFTGCGSKESTQYECGKKTYDNLNTAAEICMDMMESIYNAWSFAIYDAGNYDYYALSTALPAFVAAVGIPEEDLQTANRELGGVNISAYLDDFNHMVSVVEKAYELNGTVETLDNALNTAKAELKTMSSKYSDYSEYPTLKSYYSEVNSYAEFIKSPECTLEQLKTTRQEYENNIRSYKSDLEINFED